MASFFRAYSAFLVRRPMAAQCATSVVLFGTGDAIAQQMIEGKGKGHDMTRTARLAFYGGVLFAPPVTKWLQFLGRLNFSTPAKTVIYRTWLDQSIAGPAAVGWFFTAMTFLEGKGVAEVMERLETKYVPTLVRGWAVFGPAQLVNFAIVPPQFRFLFIGGVSLCWNTYLSAIHAQQHVVDEMDIPIY
ncbi:hypothetical protein FA95DRAFT_993047 [Auriscalpium vulgare]|uniref:Uncharacterized protein n=1 Tax=Auriscalpium vulgare TaxID=40419 RepID=A0ACB8R7R1_9AGAM|nr:hypothetical protein FA95DRAFT_993047 [Auriscalpium vulgare]